MIRLDTLIGYLRRAFAARRALGSILAVALVLTSGLAAPLNHSGGSPGQPGVIAVVPDAAAPSDAHSGGRAHCHCAQPLRPGSDVSPPVRVSKLTVFRWKSEVGAPKFDPSPLVEPPRT